MLAGFIALAAATGARRGELWGLRWQDLEPSGTLQIRHAAKHGHDARTIELRDTKTHQARKVALDVFAMAVLDRHREQAEGWARSTGANLGPNCYILTVDPTGITPTKPDTVTQQFEALTKSCGLGLRFHDLRHFTATQLLGANIDPRPLAGRLGHADPAITMRVYASFLQERDREAASVIGALLSGPLPIPDH